MAIEANVIHSKLFDGLNVERKRRRFIFVSSVAVSAHKDDPIR